MTGVGLVVESEFTCGTVYTVGLSGVKNSQVTGRRTVVNAKGELLWEYISETGLLNPCRLSPQELK